MSELNRLLSDIVSPDGTENKLSVAQVPTSKRVIIARVTIVSLAVLMSASGIAWTISNVTEKQEVDVESIPQSSMYSAISPIENSPTTRVQDRAHSFVSKESLEEIKRKPLMLAQQQMMAQAAPVPVSNSSMKIESVELSRDELAEIAYRKAQKFAQQGDTQRAIDELYETVQFDENHIGGINQLAGMLYGRGLTKDAENVLRKGIQKNPRSSALKLTLARMYQQIDREEAALNILSAKQEMLDGNQINIVAMRAALAQKLGHNDLAQNSYRWLSIQEPTEGRWWLGLAVSAERKQMTDQAVWAYETAIDTGGLSDQSIQFARQRIDFIQTQSMNSGVVNDG